MDAPRPLDAPLPIGLLYVMHRMNFRAMAFAMLHGVALFSYWVLSCVLQGCPLSGDLYIIC